MQFRSTAYDPLDSQVLRQNDPQIDFGSMEKKLAQEMSKMQITDERKKREIQKICTESDELKELQAKIKAAYLNKERTAQIAEFQYRSQQDLEQDAAIEIEMLHRKEKSDADSRQSAFEKQQQLFALKNDIQNQMVNRELLREEAMHEYMKERLNVDAIINKMIEEDHEMIRINKMKQEQSKQDMVLSMNEKKALMNRQRELEEYEEELVRQYAGQQQERADNLHALKEQAEAQREEIFNRLAQEEAQRVADMAYVENLRNDLQVEEIRMREQQHKREIERLWQEKLEVYRVQREQEYDERLEASNLENFKQQTVAAEKERLLKEHAQILNNFNPKAASTYGTGNRF